MKYVAVTIPVFILVMISFGMSDVFGYDGKIRMGFDSLYYNTGDTAILSGYVYGEDEPFPLEQVTLTFTDRITGTIIHNDMVSLGPIETVPGEDGKLREFTYLIDTADSQWEARKSYIVTAEYDGITDNTRFRFNPTPEQQTLELSKQQSDESVSQTPSGVERSMPDWVRNIFIFYANEEISDDELFNAIEFLIDKGVIVVNR